MVEMYSIAGIQVNDQSDEEFGLPGNPKTVCFAIGRGFLAIDTRRPPELP